jgi:hypothetical protein
VEEPYNRRPVFPDPPGLHDLLAERDSLEGRQGEIKLIHTLEGILNLPLSDEHNLRAMQLEQLESMTSSLQERLRRRG